MMDKTPESSPDPNEIFTLKQGNWVSQMFPVGTLQATRREILGRGLNPDALLKQRLIYPKPKPEPAPVPAVVDPVVSAPAAPESAAAIEPPAPATAPDPPKPPPPSPSKK